MRSSKSSAYESIYDSVETRALTQNTTDESATSACVLASSVAIADPNNSSAAHVSTVVVNNSQNSGNSCSERGEVNLSHAGK